MQLLIAQIHEAPSIGGLSRKMVFFYIANIEFYFYQRMCRSNIFEAIVSAVVAETEISKEQICSHSKLADVVEARRIAYHYLQRAGFYPSQIARLMGQSRQGANFLLKTCKNPSKIAVIYCKHLDKVLAEYLLTLPDV